LFQGINVDAALHKVDFDDLGELAQCVASTSGIPDVTVEAGQLTARFQTLSANIEVCKVFILRLNVGVFVFYIGVSIINWRVNSMSLLHEFFKASYREVAAHDIATVGRTIIKRPLCERERPYLMPNFTRKSG
jgi:hypothetical protein